MSQQHRLSGFGFSNQLHLEISETNSIDKSLSAFNVVFKYYNVSYVDSKLAVKVYVLFNQLR